MNPRPVPSFLIAVASALAWPAGGAPAQMKWTKFGGPTPSARTNSAIAYDASRFQIVMLGGRDALGVVGETWLWDGLAWKQSKAVPSPPAREYHSIAFDPVRRRTVVFGGRAGLTALGDTWEWDGTAWKKMAPSNMPPARSEHAMAFDARTGGVVMYGGIDGRFRLLNDFWLWNGKDWKQLASGPKGRRRHGLAADLLGKLVLCGGITSDWPGVKVAPTWVWDGSKWAKQTLRLDVPIGLTRGAAYDPLRGVTCLLGQPSASNQPTVWEWNGVAWTRRVVPGGPPDGPEHALAFSRTSGAMVVIAPGDVANKKSSETWLYEPTHLPRLDSYGNSCKGTPGLPSLGAGSGPQSLPWIGSDLLLLGSVLRPSGPGVMLIGSSRTRWGSTALPFALAGIGAPGCFLRASPDLALPVVADARGQLRFRAPIPDNPWLLGKQLHAQLAAADRAANALGVVTTNGMSATFGGR